MTTSSETKFLKWSKMVWRDWSGDKALQGMSLAAKGLWMDMLAIMFEAEPHGHLVASGVALTHQRLARIVGDSPDVIASLLTELEEAGVFSRTREGVIYSRRLVRDRQAFLEAQAYGRMGGNPNIVGRSKPRKSAASEGALTPISTPPLTLDIEKEIEEERVLATLVADDPPPVALQRIQTSLLDDAPPKPKTDAQLLFSEGSEILASLTGKDLGKLPHRQAVSSLLAKLRKEAGEGQDATLLGIIRKAADQPPLSAIGWIKGAIANNKPRLVVSNDAPEDPNDLWGIKRFCQRSPNCRPVVPSDYEPPADATWATPDVRQKAIRDKGEFICHRMYIDKFAKALALEACLPATWRGDWSPLETWMSHGISLDEIVSKVGKRVAWLRSQGDYQPATVNLARFNSTVLEGRVAA